MDYMCTSASSEEYLKWILIIQKRLGSVRSVELAEHMGFSKPSICVAIKKLQEGQLLIKDRRGYLHLTQRGQEIAESIHERHEFFTELFSNLGVDKDIAEQDACQIEHVISEQTYQKIRQKYI